MASALQAGPTGPAFSLGKPLLLSLALHAACVAWLALGGWQAWLEGLARRPGAVPAPSGLSLLMDLREGPTSSPATTLPAPSGRTAPTPPRDPAPVQFERELAQDSRADRALMASPALPGPGAGAPAPSADLGQEAPAPSSAPPAPALPAGLAFGMPRFGGGRGLFQPPRPGPAWEAAREDMLRQQLEQSRQAAWSEGLRQLHAQLLRQLPAGQRLDCRFDTRWTCQGGDAALLQPFAGIAQPLRLLRPELVLTLRREGNSLALDVEPAADR